MALVNGRLVIALALTVALLAAVPAAAPAGNAGAAKTTCKKKAKGKKKKKCPVKKKAARFPADGTYNSGDGAVNINVSTRGGKRIVQVRVRIPLTCAPSGVTQPRTMSVTNLPLSGTGFQGKAGPDRIFGETTVSGAFLSATKVHVKAQTTNYPNGTELCGGSVDLTTTVKPGY